MVAVAVAASVALGTGVIVAEAKRMPPFADDVATAGSSNAPYCITIAVLVGESERVKVAVVVAVLVAVGVCDAYTIPKLMATVATAGSMTAPNGIIIAVCVGDTVAVLVPVVDGVKVGVTVAVRVLVAVAVSLTVGVGVTVAVIVAVFVAVNVAVGVSLSTRIP